MTSTSRTYVPDRSPNLVRTLAKYVQALVIGIQNALEYRANFLIHMVSALWPIIIQSFLWSAIYGSSDKAAVFGYTYTGMIAYTVIANLTARLVRTGFEYEMNDDIRNGGLAKYIIRPVSYFGYRLASFLGQKLIQSAFMAIVLAVAVSVLASVVGAGFSSAGVLLFPATLLFAFLLNYMIFFCVGTIGFYLTEIGFLFEAVRIVIIALSGGIFPLTVFGPWGEAILSALPFRYTINFPVQVLTMKVTGTEIFSGLTFQFIWCVVLGLVAGLPWKIGMKRYVAVGG